MAWTTPVVWVAGQVVTASTMNAQVSANLNYLYGLVGTQPTGNRNALHNGEFSVSQRGQNTAIACSSTTTITARTGPDRWLAYCTTAGEATWTANGTPGSALANFSGFCRIQRTAGQTAVASIYVMQGVESHDAVRLAGQPVTLSFWARSGANFSSASSQLTPRIVSGTGQDENVVAGYTGAVTEATTGVTLTTSWQRFTLTAASIQSTATEVRVDFSFTPSGTAGAADYFDITGVQLEIGSTASPYEHISQATELQRCQKFYYRPIIDGGLEGIGSGYFSATTTFNAWLPLPSPMRTTPILNVSAAADISVACVAGNLVASAVTGARLGPNSVQVVATVAGATAGQSGILFVNTSAKWIELIADL